MYKKDNANNNNNINITIGNNIISITENLDLIYKLNPQTHIFK